MAKRGPKKLHRGNWKQGQSGNPAGYPKGTTEFRQRIREDEKIHDLLFRAARGELTEAERRKFDGQTLRFMVEQGHGRAPQAIKVDGMLTLDEAAKEIREFLLRYPEIEAELDAWLESKRSQT